MWDRDTWLLLFACGGILVFLGAWAKYIWANRSNPSWVTEIPNHFPATVALPVATGVAAMIVVLFRAAEGQEIKFGVTVFTFEGASGPIVMWVLCFLAIIFAIWLLWGLTLSK
jgi:hypothetical protein